MSEFDNDLLKWSYMEEQSGRFLLLRIDLMAFNIKSSKSLLVIVSSSVSIVMQFESGSIF